MFTSIIHPINGEEIQIRSGDDQLDTYKVGDKVKRYINRNRYKSGCLFDGAYDGIFSKKEENNENYYDCIVIIQNGVIKEVIDHYKSREEFGDFYNYYLSIYPTIIPKQLYSSAAYSEWKRINTHYRKKFRRERLKNRKLRKSFIIKYGKDKGNMMYAGHILTMPIKRALDLGSITRKFVQVEEWPAGKPIPMDNIGQVNAKDPKFIEDMQYMETKIRDVLLK